jgi:hypothetical protein
MLDSIKAPKSQVSNQVPLIKHIVSTNTKVTQPIPLCARLRVLKGKNHYKKSVQGREQFPPCEVHHLYAGRCDRVYGRCHGQLLDDQMRATSFQFLRCSHPKELTAVKN